MMLVAVRCSDRCSGGAAVAAPVTSTASVIPICRCPTTEHQPVEVAADDADVEVRSPRRVRSGRCRRRSRGPGRGRRRRRRCATRSPAGRRPAPRSRSGLKRMPSRHDLDVDGLAGGGDARGVGRRARLPSAAGSTAPPAATASTASGEPRRRPARVSGRGRRGDRGRRLARRWRRACATARACSSGTKLRERDEHQRPRRARARALGTGSRQHQRSPALARATAQGARRSRTALARAHRRRAAAEGHRHQVGQGAEQHLGARSRRPGSGASARERASRHVGPRGADARPAPQPATSSADEPRHAGARPTRRGSGRRLAARRRRPAAGAVTHDPGEVRRRARARHERALAGHAAAGDEPEPPRRHGQGRAAAPLGALGDPGAQHRRPQGDQRAQHGEADPAEHVDARRGRRRSRVCQRVGEAAREPHAQARRRPAAATPAAT